METIIAIALSLLAGGLLGFIFFGGLWKTVQRMSLLKRPYLWMFVSFVIRVTIVMLGFYLIMQVQWQLMAVALLGFIFARFWIIRHATQQARSAENRQ